MRGLFETMLRDARGRASGWPRRRRGWRGCSPTGRPTRAPSATAVQDAEAARREVRLVHLLAHLQTHDVLTEAQRQKYHELRWGPGTAR